MRSPLLCSLLIAATALPVHAGGLVLPNRGVRTLARAGAYVAGAEDADALWQNPAGLAHGAGPARRTLLFDLAIVHHAVERRTDGGSVDNERPTQPVPALAGSLGVGERLVIAGGMATPQAALYRYAPVAFSRFAAITDAGSTQVVLAIGAAYRIGERLRVGATLTNTVSLVEYEIDVVGAGLALDAQDHVAPSGSLGLQLDATPTVTLGAAITGPTRVSAGGTLTVTPEADAEVTGDRGRMAYWLPPVVRAGVELRPRPDLRIEAALGVELWSVHDEVELAGEGIAVGGVPLAAMAIPRDYHTSVSAALGAEWTLGELVLGAGYAYETSAAPAATVTPAAVDAGKHILGLGAGYAAEGWQIGAAVGVGLVADVEVVDGRVPVLSPLDAEPDAVGAAANNGRYASRYLIGGVRFARRW